MRLALSINRWSIGTLLTALITPCIALWLAATTAMEIRGERARFRAGLESSGRILASTLTGAIANDMYFGYFDSVSDTAELFSSQPDIAYVRVYAPDGSLLIDVPSSRGVVGTHAAEAATGLLPVTETGLLFRGDSLEVTRPVVVGKDFLGTVRFAFNEEILRAAIRRIVKSQVIEGPILLAVAVALSYILGRFMARPVKRLSDAARRIAAGDFDIPVGRQPTHEVGALASSFEHMRRGLKAAQARVAERTAQLETTNQQLLAEIAERRRAEKSLEQQVRERAILTDISRTVGSSLDFQEVFDRFTALVGSLLPFDRIAVSTVDREAGTVAVSHVDGVPIRSTDRGEPVPRPGTIAEFAVRRGIARLVPVGSPEQFAREHPGIARDVIHVGFQSLIAVPVRIGGETIGTLELASGRDLYSDRVLEVAQAIGSQVAGAVANSRRHTETLQLADELNRANESKSRFLSTVSHELKTPLTSMLAFTEILLDDPNGDLKPEQVEQLRVIDRNGYRLNLLINDILDLSRIDAGTIKITPTNFPARVLLEELVDSLIPLFEKRGQALRTLLPSDELWINADRNRLAQIMSNLLINASKYSPEHSTVQLTARGDGNQLWVTVRDYGIGISEEDQKDLFTAFFRADNSATRAVSGTGLGLVIAKSLVEMHGGEISIESEVGEGTSATFYVHGLLPGPPDERGHSRLEAIREPGSRLDELEGDTALSATD